VLLGSTVPEINDGTTACCDDADVIGSLVPAALGRADGSTGPSLAQIVSTSN
jgi:hypothetical protein